MIKKGMLVVLLMASFCGMAYAAPDRVGKSELGFNVSGAIPKDSGVDTAAYIGGTYAYGLQEWLAVGVETGWAGFSEPGLDENAYPILGDIILRVPMDSQVKPYGIIGLGAIVWDASTSISNASVDIDTAFAAKFGGGVDWFVNDNWAVNFEAAYIASSTDATVRNTSTGASVSVSGDTDYWTVGGGLKYLFS